MSECYKTKPCPICDSELRLPDTYLDAVKRLREKTEKDFQHWIAEIKEEIKEHIIRDTEKRVVDEVMEMAKKHTLRPESFIRELKEKFGLK